MNVLPCVFSGAVVSSASDLSGASYKPQVGKVILPLRSYAKCISNDIFILCHSSYFVLQSGQFFFKFQKPHNENDRDNCK